ncbi:MAG TPA: hypothetical protein DEF45_18095 [Rhodopirellula sp.]|nr:hypothetical protein [Rhodopirellula sp.]
MVTLSCFSETGLAIDKGCRESVNLQFFSQPVPTQVVEHPLDHYYKSGESLVCPFRLTRRKVTGSSGFSCLPGQWFESVTWSLAQFHTRGEKTLKFVEAAIFGIC